MSWVDITIIALVVLFGLFGVWKGIQKSSLALGAFLVAFVIAFFLANVVAEAFLNIEAVRKFVLGNDVAGESGFSLYSFILNTTSAEPSEFHTEYYIKPILEKISECKKYNTTFTPQNGYALYQAFNVFSLIIGVGLYLVVRGLLCFATMIIKMYIPRKKSAGNRVAGFFMGVLRGAVWSFVITIIFTILVGLPVSFFNTVENEYEDSVVGKYVYQYSYAIKNHLYLPSADMYGRIVDKSGYAKDEVDLKEPDTHVKEKNMLMVDMLNLNYNSGTAYEYNETTGKVEEHLENATAVDPQAYADTGFDAAISAIMAYNRKAAVSIQDGSLSAADTAKLALYDETYGKIYDEMYGGSDNLFKDLYNYLTDVNDAKTVDYRTGELYVEELNIKLSTEYNCIVTHLQNIKELYDKFDLFVAQDSVGTLTLPTMPELVVAVKPAEGPEAEAE